MPPIEHGWKLHVSARPSTLQATVDAVLPILVNHTCDAKFAPDASTLRELNAGLTHPATVGKAITVYPHPTALRVLAGELVRALRGWSGPRILSDRRVSPDAPVYYRYGPFRSPLRTGHDGAVDLPMIGPDGASFPGLATPEYRCPPWAEDPFHSAEPRTSATPLLHNGRYRITTGIARSPNGNVYRAVDATTGRRVVIKQARAFVGEDLDDMDACARLRHERRILTALSDVHRVPRVVDWFTLGGDDYLVTTDCGDRTLARDVRAGGRYLTGPVDVDARHKGGDDSRGLTALARSLLGILDAVHARDTVVRDLKPTNVVLDADRTCHLVDFGISRFQDFQIRGATKGYSPACQWRNAPARPADDYYALGATLYYAATGLDPVVIDPDDATNRERSLACLAAMDPDHGRRPICSVIADLLSPDEAERVAAASRLRGGLKARTPAPAPLPRPPRVGAGLLRDVIAHTVDDCLGRAEAMMDSAGAGHTPRLSVYDGASGLGLELLHHGQAPRVRDVVTRLARWVGDSPALDTLPSGLYHGRTGAALFLAAAAPLLDGPTTVPGAEPPPHCCAEPVRSSPGQLQGLAGLGTGHLLLARHASTERCARRHRWLAAHCRRLLTAGSPPGVHAPSSVATLAGTEAYDFAHGTAGTAYFLLAHHRVVQDAGSNAATRAQCDALAAAVPGILTAAAAPAAHPLYGSWCRGLAGIGTTLLQAAAVYPDGPFLSLALRTARACRALAPRIPGVSQCCGLAGLGELLIDTATATGDEEFWQGAYDVAGLILARSGGQPRHPVFPDNSLSTSSAAWGTGSTGVLSFIRRLHRRGGPRLCLTD